MEGLVRRLRKGSGQDAPLRGPRPLSNAGTGLQVGSIPHAGRPAIPTRSAALLLALAVSARPAAPQECADTAVPGVVDQLARQHAPFLWFSPGEDYFPTVPFFPAFDTVAPRAPGLVGLRDPRRIVTTHLHLPPELRPDPLTLRDPHLRIVDTTRFYRGDWNHLDSAYAKRRRGPVTPPHSIAVFYRLRCLDRSATETLWSFLRNDTQAWWRSKVWQLYDRGLRDARFLSIEYYFYYVRDVGLRGHPGDVEKLAILRPINPPASERGGRPPLDSLLLDSLRVIIGAGHGFTTPNNILVEVGPSRDGSLRDGYAHPHVLVELGGHSVAPDKSPPDGRFNVGWDINWHVSSEVWGVRDVQGLSGTGYVGAYRDWMTLPRYAGNSVRLSPRFAPAQTLDEATARRRDSVAVADEEQRTWQAAPRREVTVPRRAPADSARGDYLLLPVGPFDRLFRLLVEDTLAGGVGRSADAGHLRTHERIRAVVDDEIRPLLEDWRFTGFEGIPQDSIDAAIHLMHYWTRPLDAGHREVPLYRMHFWEDFEYRNSPTFLLKSYLHRPTQNGLRRFPADFLALLTGNVDFHLGSDGGKQLQLGILYPAGARALMEIPGVVELQVGFYGREAIDFGRGRLSLSLLYDRHYRRFLSWYIRPIGWVRHRGAVERDSTASDVVLGFGGSVMPFLLMADKLPPPWRHLATTTRIRAGFRVDMKDLRPNPQRVEVQVSLYAR